MHADLLSITLLILLSIDVYRLLLAILSKSFPFVLLPFSSSTPRMNTCCTYIDCGRRSLLSYSLGFLLLVIDDAVSLFLVAFVLIVGLDLNECEYEHT